MNTKAVSPVVATILMVAITATLTIFVASFTLAMFQLKEAKTVLAERIDETNIKCS